MDEILRILSELGVVETATPLHVPVSLAAPTSELAGQLGNGLDGLEDEEDDAPKSQPSLFRKALAFALVDQLSTATNLADQDQALFLAEPNQAGVPAGNAYPQQVSNYQTFTKADVMQRVDQFSYNLGGNSYFEYLAAYLRNVVKPGTDSEDLIAARSALFAAKKAKDVAYEEARQNYLSTRSNSSGTATSFIDTLNDSQKYLAEWTVEEQCEAKYTELQDSSMIDFSRQLDQIKSADDRLVRRDINNMPCIAVSEDYIHDPSVMAGGKLVIDTKDIYYRPFYNLPNFAAICNDWQNLNTNPSTTERHGPIHIDLLDAQQRSWSELGHMRLDSAKRQELTADQRRVLKQLRITITFIGSPAVIDIDRGYWDVPYFRKKLPDLAQDAPAALRRKVCKTVRMMFAWSVEMSIKMLNTGEVNATLASTDLTNFNPTFLKLGLVPSSTKPDEILYRSSIAPYPLLLAVLARTT